MRIIEPRFLISEDLANITKEILKEDNVLDILMDNLERMATGSDLRNQIV